MDRGTFRRAFLSGVAGASLAAPLAAVAVSPDAELLRLCRTLAAARAELARIDREGASEEVCMAALDAWGELTEQLIDTPATTAEGYRAKAGALRDRLDWTLRNGPGISIVDLARPHDLLAWSLVHDVLGEEADWS